MTKREEKLFKIIKESNPEIEILPPLFISTYSLSDTEEYVIEKSPKDKKRADKDSKGAEYYSDLHSTDGIVFIYSDKAVLFERKEKIKEIALESLSDLEVRIYNSSIVLCENDRIICRSDLKGKKEISLISKKAKAYSENRILQREEKEVRFCEKCGRVLESDDAKYCVHCKTPKGTLKRLYSYTKGARFFIFISVFSFFAVTGINLLSPYVSKLLVDEYIEPKNAYFAGFITIVLAMLGISLLSRFLTIIRSRFLTRASEKMIVRLRDDVFAKIQKLSVSNVSRRTAGSLMHRVTRDTQQVQVCLTDQFPSLIEQSLTLIGVTAIIVYYDWRLAILIFAPVPIVVIAQRLMWKRLGRMYDRQWMAETKVETFLHDIFSGIRVVKAFGTEKRDNVKFENLTNEECRISARNERFYAIFSPMVTYVISIGELFMLYFVGMSKINGEMTLGDIAMFTAYVGLVYGPINWFGSLIRQLTRGLRSAAKVFEIMDEKEDVKDIEKALTPEITGNIELKNVYFGYDESKEVLHGVNLKIKPGEMIGIVGRSGAGKSTLINLIMRMYDPDEGEVLFDSINAKDISQEYLRSKIGAVLQETFLFSGSVYDNIAYAKPGATRDEVLAASKIAGAHGFIIKLPDGYNTKVGEKGYTLSGGERQRVTIARALLHDPKILILDEATSALDTETEKQIQDALAKLIENRTTIAIAHRLSTLRNATRLIVVDKGKIAEEGSHDELMKQKGIYYNLVMAQRQMGLKNIK